MRGVQQCTPARLAPQVLHLLPWYQPLGPEDQRIRFENNYNNRPVRAGRNSNLLDLMRIHIRIIFQPRGFVFELGNEGSYDYEQKYCGTFLSLTIFSFFGETECFKLYPNILI